MLDRLFKFILFATVLLFGISFNAYAQCGDTIDFSSWYQTALPANGNWVPSNIVNGKALTVSQTENGEPTFFVSPDTFINVEITGKIEVNTNNDDDWVGFVFGYRDPPDTLNTDTCEFFLFDWKQNGQNNFYNGTQPAAEEGFTLCKVKGVFDWNNNISFSPYFFSHKTDPAGSFTVLDSLYGPTQGWADQTEYEFTLVYTVTSIIIIVENDTIFERNGCFEPGKFGFYNFSQDNVIYSDFNYKLNGDFTIIGDRVCFGDTSELISVFDTCFNQNATFAQIASWDWDLGDGTTSNDTNVNHTYANPGFYNISLIVTDQTGVCKDTAYKTVEVFTLPDVNLGNDTLTCLLDTIVLDAGAGYSYNWNTGDTTRYIGANSIDSFFVTITDAQSCIDIDTLVVTGIYTNAPTPICQNATVYLDSSGNVSIDTTTINNGSFAFCQIDTMWVNPSIFDCNDIGANSTKLYVRDVNGNLDSCSATVTVLDTIRPTIVAVNDTVWLDQTGNTSFNIINFNKGSTDNCTLTGLTTDINSLTCTDTGFNNVVITATDQSSNASVDTFQVLVLDSLPPTAICYNSINVYLSTAGTFTIDSAFIDSSSTDNCGIANWALSKTNFSCADVGIDTVGLTLTDFSGNQSTCSTAIQVIDSISPLLSCLDTVVYLDSSGMGTILIDGAVPISFFEDWTGEGVNTYFANTSTSQWNVTGDIDLADFVQGIPGKEIDLAGFGNGAIQSIQNFTFSPGVYTFSYLDSTNNPANNSSVQIIIGSLVNQTIASDLSIQSHSITFQVSTTETAPVQMIQLGPNDPGGSFIGNISLTGQPYYFKTISGFSDSCGIQSIVASDTTFDCNELDTNLITLTVIDLNGNVSTCQSNVVVLDSLKPNIVAVNDTVWLDSTGNVSFNIINFNRGTTDNCTLTNLVTDITSLNCTDTGFNDVKITATDQSNNQDSLIVQLLVLDSIKPTPLCRDTFRIELDSSGAFVLDSSHIDTGSFDNCGIQSWLLSDTLFTCNNLGFDTVSLTITDFSGNQNTCSSIIQIVDTTRPSPICFSDTTVYLDSLGFINLDSAFVDQSSFDNCGIASWTLSDTTFNCTQIDTFSITYTVFDGSGNSNSCITNIIVLDSLPPVLLTKNDTLWLDSAGNTSFNFTNFNQGFSDNCQIDSLWTSSTSLACADTGLNTIKYFGRDVNGNVDSLNVQLLIIDSVAPSLTCPTDTVLSNDSTFCYVIDSLPQPLFGDSCGILSIVNSFNITAFLNDTFPVDTHLISWTVTDVNGNSSSCSFSLTVIDTEVPTIVCPADTAIGYCHDTLIYALPVFSDNCPGSMLSLDSGIGSGVHFPIGNNIEYYTVTDAFGNTASCTTTVFVDTIPFLQLGPDTAICDYDEILLYAGISFNAGADSNFTYLWQDSSNAIEFIANYADTFYVTKTDSFGCTAVDSISLGILTSPSLPFVSDTGICIGDTALLRAGPDSSVYTYTWADDTSGFISNNISITTSDSGNFSILKVDTTTTCFATDTIFVTVNPLPTPDIGNDTSICDGLIITFDAFNNYERYTWQDSSSSTIYTTDSAGLYTVTVSDFNGCVGSDSLTLSIFPTPVVNFSVMHDSIPVVNTDDSSRVCDGVTVSIQVVDSFNIFFWSTGSPLQNIDVNTSGNYNVLVFDSNNCNSNATYKVVVDTLPFVNLGNDTTICNQDSMVIDAGPDLISYAWNSGDTTQTLQIFTADTFSVVVTDSSSCVGVDTFILNIDTLPRVNLGADTTICLRDDIVVSPGSQYASYQWSFFAPDTHSVAISTPGDYWVVVTDANQCSATSDTLTLANDTLPNVQLGADQGICIGDSVILDAGPGYSSYAWSNGLSVQSQVVNTTGSFVVTVVDANQCIGSDTFNLVVNSLPVVSLGSNKRYCDGVSFNLQLTANSGPPYQSYLWSTAQTGQGITVCDQPGCPNVITSFPDTIWVVATDINGCINTDTLTIDRGANPVVNINMSDTSYCSDEVKSIVLDAGPGFNSYNWNNGESGQIILVDTAGQYSVLVSDVNGCSGNDIIQIREYQAPLINLPQDTSFCENVAFSLNLNAGAGVGYQYDWSTSETTQTIVANTTGTYAVTVTTPEFCDADDKITIGQVPLPNSGLENDTLVCSGAFLELDVFNEGYTYLWNTGSLDSAILVDTSGLYSVRLRNKFCTGRDTAFVQYDYVPFIDLGPDSILCQGEVAVLDASFPNSRVSYIWQDGSEDTTYSASFAGNYSVLVTNRCGSFLDNIELFYEDCSNIYAPTSFSPNGDGDNDFYRLYSDQNFTFYELQIFNRGGEPVFQSSAEDVQWDGTFNGTPSPIGAYTYYLRYSSDLDPNGGVYTQTGVVVLIR